MDSGARREEGVFYIEHTDPRRTARDRRHLQTLVMKRSKRRLCKTIDDTMDDAQRAAPSFRAWVGTAHEPIGWCGIFARSPFCAPSTSDRPSDTAIVRVSLPAFERYPMQRGSASRSTHKSPDFDTRTACMEQCVFQIHIFTIGTRLLPQSILSANLHVPTRRISTVRANRQKS